MIVTEVPTTVQDLKSWVQMTMEATMEAVRVHNVDCSLAHSHVLMSIHDHKVELLKATLTEGTEPQVLDYANNGEMRLCLGCSVDPETFRLRMRFSLGYKTPGDCAHEGPMDSVSLRYEAAQKEGSEMRCAWSISAMPRSARAHALIQRLDRGLVYTDVRPCVTLPARMRKKLCHEPHHPYYLGLVDRMLACFLDPHREPPKISI